MDKSNMLECPLNSLNCAYSCANPCTTVIQISCTFKLRPASIISDHSGYVITKLDSARADCRFCMSAAAKRGKFTHKLLLRSHDEVGKAAKIREYRHVSSLRADVLSPWRTLSESLMPESGI